MSSLRTVGASKVVGMAEDEKERGVHGGEYSTRPNMQESMVFLRKLFSHQQENTFANVLSPPDGPMSMFSKSIFESDRFLPLIDCVVVVHSPENRFRSCWERR